VCLYAYMSVHGYGHVRMCIRVYAYVYVYVFMFMYEYVYVSVSVSVSVYVHVCEEEAGVLCALIGFFFYLGTEGQQPRLHQGCHSAMVLRGTDREQHTHAWSTWSRGAAHKNTNASRDSTQHAPGSLMRTNAAHTSCASTGPTTPPTPPSQGLLPAAP
jgi:hypothetical protein